MHNLPSKVLSVTYLRSFEPMLKMYTIYKRRVQMLSSQLSHQQGEPFCKAVMYWSQNLNRLIKSWGERETEQLSGLLAVQGWSVPFQDRM